ncbi:hypothetical protein [Fictibacillus sp. JL2B1089]|uniref:hypothetical protein n=1 Tax=Fictibacillus sp. JL2B1089 TaxID=3399565 RepID=UPI003A8A9769
MSSHRTIEVYRYSVVGEIEISKEQKQKAINMLKEYKVSPTLIEEKELNNSYEVARSIKTLKQEKSNAVNAASVVRHWINNDPGVEFVYSTFIPTPEVKMDVPGSPYDLFKGDDRGFDQYNVPWKTYRTRTWTRVSFLPAGGSVVRFFAHANPTTGRNEVTKKWKTEPNSQKNMYLTSKYEGTDRASFLINHNAKNEMHDVAGFSAPGITYQVNGDVYRNGYFEISGYHDRAPNHEISFTKVPGETHIMDKKVQYSTLQRLHRSGINGYTVEFLTYLSGIAQVQFHESGYWN